MNHGHITAAGLYVAPRFAGADAFVDMHLGRLCFRCDAWWYELRDIEIRDGRRLTYPLEDPRATHRAFVMANRSAWVYEFTQDEPRDVGPHTCLRQIGAAEYVNRGHGQGQ